MITFNKKWFNPLYFILNDLGKRPTIRTILIYGGKSSSKTVSITQWLVKEMTVKGANTIAFRKESTSIPTTLKKSFNLSIDKMYLSPAIVRLDRRYFCRLNNAEIVMRGLDDQEKAKGVESYKYLYFDELNHFEQTEWEQANLSLRGIEGQKLLASWNPVDENSWVKTDLVDKYQFEEMPEFKLPCEDSFVKISTCGKVVLIKTTYPDNYWINGSPCGTYGYRDENLIAEYESLRTRNANSYKVNVLGEWGKTVFGGEILKNWRTEIHTGLYPYNPNLAVHLIFDENVNPYFPCGIFQIDEQQIDVNGKKETQTDIYLIHAIALKNPDNTTKAMGRVINRKLLEWGHKEAVFIGGDPASKKEDVKQEKGHNLFRLLQGELADWKPRLNLLNVAPSVRMSTDFFNSILSGDIKYLSYKVDKSCRVAINDYENTKEDKNGKVDKKTVTDPITKVSYQPFGHFFDLSRYFLCFSCSHQYSIYQRAGNPLRISQGGNQSRNAV